MYPPSLVGVEDGGVHVDLLGDGLPQGGPGHVGHDSGACLARLTVDEGKDSHLALGGSVVHLLPLAGNNAGWLGGVGDLGSPAPLVPVGEGAAHVRLVGYHGAAEHGS